MEKEPIVYIVDDDQAVRDSLVMLLKSEAILARAFASATEFLQSAQPDQPGCLVLDVSMPEMSGLQLLDVLAKERRRIPAIFITGHGDGAMAKKALSAGAFDFLVKPVDNDQLISRIRDAIAHDLRIRQGEMDES